MLHLKQAPAIRYKPLRLEPQQLNGQKHCPLPLRANALLPAEY